MPKLSAGEGLLMIRLSSLEYSKERGQVWRLSNDELSMKKAPSVRGRGFI